jgi:thioredoxin
MSVFEITTSNFDHAIETNDIVFIDFWAEWCAPCKTFATIFTEVALENRDIVFAKIDIENEGEISSAFQIRSIPHLLVFKQGIVIYSESGNIPKSTLIELVEQSRVADVSELKKKLEGEK